MQILAPTSALPADFDRDLRVAHELAQGARTLLGQTGSTGHGALYDPTVAPPAQRYAQVLANAAEAQALVARYAENEAVGENGRRHLRSAAGTLGRLSAFLGAGPSTDEINVKLFSLLSQAESAAHALHAARTASD